MRRMLRVSAAFVTCAAVAIAPVTAAEALSLSLPTWAVDLNAARSVSDKEDLVDHQQETLLQFHRTTSSPDAFLVIGAKSSVVHGFSRRQAIRQTWAAAAFVPDGVEIVFLGCQPDLSMLSSSKQQQVREAIALEKRVYGDLLTDELFLCEDSYAGLSDKTKAFMHWVTTAYPSLAYVMEVDDDAYVRLDRVMSLLRRPSTPRTRYFAGNSASTAWRGLGIPFRDPRHKYYVSKRAYPMNQFPPYVSGQHFILSRDLVRLIGRNVAELRGHGGLDDMAVGLWLFAMLQIKVTYIDELEALRYISACSDAVISLADLTAPAIRFVHANVASGKRLCYNFRIADWLKKSRAVVASSRHASPGDEECLFSWNLALDARHHRLDVKVTMTVGPATVDFVYVPSAAIAEEGFCGQTARLLHERLYYTGGDELCGYHSNLLLSFLDQAPHALPTLAPIVLLARHNLRRMQISDQGYFPKYVSPGETHASFHPSKRPFFTAVLSANASIYRVLVECLLVELHPEKQIIMLNDDKDPSTWRRVDLYVISTLDRLNDRTDIATRAKTVFHVEERSFQPYAGDDIDSRVVILSVRQRNELRAFPILLASRVFANTLKHSPATLLQPVYQVPVESRQGICILSDSLQDPQDSSLSSLLPFLQEIHDHPRVHVVPERSRFYLDMAIDAIADAKFVIVSSFNTDTIEDVGDLVVMAFLAGAIPVIVGNVSTSDLFNPNAFIHCGSLANLRDCANFVAEVDQSPFLYEQLRREAPIDDHRVFEEAFSWHPHVSSAMTTDAERLRDRLHRFLAKSP